MDDSKETVFSRHNRALAHMNSETVAAHTVSEQIKARQGPCTEIRRAQTSNQEAICNQ